MNSYRGRNILVMGLGKSGYACACFLSGMGAVVTVTDMAQEDDLTPFSTDLRKRGIHLELGGHSIKTVENSDMIVMSPGVPHTIEPIRIARKKGIPVIGEIELAAGFIQEPMIAITGTNGKTTTTRLVSEMIKASGLSVFTGGNIGTPLIDYVAGAVKTDRVVVEVSSFQLDTIQQFRPHVSVLLNITEDHLDRYDSFQSYAESKGRIFENQRKTDYAVFNRTDRLVRELSGNSMATNLFFDFTGERENTAMIHSDTIHLPKFSDIEEHIIDLSEARLTGRHNQENISAASLATLAAGGSIEGVRLALKNFTGLPHRLEYVETIGQVQYFDDSKATNVDAVLRALEAFEGKVILIMGGLDKGGDYTVLKDQLRKKVRLILVMGEAKEIIKTSLGRFVDIVETASMDEAVRAAYGSAVPGDTVLLSPACASFDMFDSYAHRGDVFRKAVKKIQEGCL
ncbi:MAG: UDP-N-acetylmuramoyl-L-alanine--D-glutamate ligase [Desulfobacteraceae bacterium]|nr:MAG: UDP-N-acetylmuramoyl-L-alanine--D-glutamate ligase [Desulfobacteraceae bacterium]